MMNVPAVMSDDERQPEDLSFEDAMESLDSIVESLEAERMPLEEMVGSYERGMKLLRVCRNRIEAARQRVELITADLEGKGKPSLSDFVVLETPETPQAAPAEEPQRRPARKKSAPVESEPNEEVSGEIRLF
ncbi:MAG: exodeoxyribonuclease VII small subunit [Roseimicrobium sp.]